MSSPDTTAVEAIIDTQWVIPVLRTGQPDEAYETARALGEGGLRCVELTMTIPDVFEVAQRLVGQGLLVGLGTVTKPAEVASAAQAGCSFVVSYCFPPGFHAAATGAKVVAIPGALTPQEIHAVDASGGSWVKIFPGTIVPPAYLRDIAQVMPRLRFMVTGGIELSAAGLSRWHAVGASAVGVGRQFGTVATAGADEVRRRASLAVELVAGLREPSTVPDGSR